MNKQVIRFCIGFIWALSAGTNTVAASESDTLPEIGDPSAGIISPIDERRLGENLLRNLRNNQLVVEDPLIQDYIDSIAYRLVAASDHIRQPFTFFVIDDAAVNAFAAPGGYIGINTGLFLLTESESELAAVIAHEIAHITQRHMSRTFEAAGKQNLATAVAILAAILLGQENIDLSSAALATGLASTAQLQLNFTRANEKEADRIGIQTLKEAGLNPTGMATFFGRLDKLSGLQGAAIPELLRTHPVSVSRISDAQNRAQSNQRKHFEENSNYYLMQARLRVLTQADSAQLKQDYQAALKNKRYLNEDASRYGYALTLMNTGDTTQAKTLIVNLLKKDPLRIAYLTALGQVQAKSGNLEAAMQVYDDALRNFPNNYPLVVDFVELLLDNNEPARAVQLLRNYTRSKQGNAIIYKLLARAAEKSGNIAEAYENMAEHYYLIGQTHAAIEQLDTALKLPALNNYQSLRMEARLDWFKEIALEEKKAEERR